MPVILKVSQGIAICDMNGLASIVPSSGGFTAPVEVDVTVTAGTSGWRDYPLQVFPAFPSKNNSEGTRTPFMGEAPVLVPRPVEPERGDRRILLKTGD
jgi:hypothetical protein